MVYLDPEVVKEVRELGLNLSKISENALKEAIRRLRTPSVQNNPENSPERSQSSLVRGVGLEPTKAFAIGASVLLLRPNSDIPAHPKYWRGNLL